MIEIKDCIQLIDKYRAQEVVLGVYSAGVSLAAYSSHPLNYFGPPPMGMASSFGLGLALALPEKKVIVLDGDGSLLMNLGSLVTIAAVSPSNLVHLVFQNDVYGLSGNQPIVGQGVVDFAEIARGAGLKKSYTIRNLEDLEERLPHFLGQPGPFFACLKVAPLREVPRELQRTSILEQVYRFKRALTEAP